MKKRVKNPKKRVENPKKRVKKPFVKPLFPFLSKKNSRKKNVKSPSLDDVREAVKDDKKVLGYLVDYGVLTKPSCCEGKKIKVLIFRGLEGVARFH